MASGGRSLPSTMPTSQEDSRKEGVAKSPALSRPGSNRFDHSGRQEGISSEQQEEQAEDVVGAGPPRSSRSGAIRPVAFIKPISRKSSAMESAPCQ